MFYVQNITLGTDHLVLNKADMIQPAFVELLVYYSSRQSSIG